MSDDLFFTHSPLGYDVYCSKEQWNKHVLRDSEHLMMSSADSIQATKEAIESPVAIFESAQSESRHIYFGKSSIPPYGSGFYTKVAVDVSDLPTYPAEVITAFPAKKISGGIGKELYPDDSESGHEI